MATCVVALESTRPSPVLWQFFGFPASIEAFSEPDEGTSPCPLPGDLSPGTQAGCVPLPELQHRNHLLEIVNNYRPT